MNIQIRNGKKVIVEEKISEYVDDVVWDMQIINRSPYGPHFLIFEILSRKSADSGGNYRTLLHTEELHDLSPQGLRAFADKCDELIRSYVEIIKRPK